jgi:hypothetical protein
VGALDNFRDPGPPTTETERIERDVNAIIKLILSEVEIAARMLPEVACHPYECEKRRKVIIKAIWAIGRRILAQESAE